MRRGERSEHTFDVGCAEDFREVMDNLILVDLPLMGGTWYNGKDSPSFSRID